MKIAAHTCRNIIHPFPVFAWIIMLAHRMMPWKKDSTSHMVLSVDDGSSIRFYEMNFFGTQVSTEKDFLKIYRIVDSHTLPLEETEVDFLKWFKSHENKKYDYLQLLGLLIRLVGVTKVNKIGHNLDRLVCTEFCLDYASKKYEIEVDDSDNYSMINTWKMITELR